MKLFGFLLILPLMTAWAQENAVDPLRSQQRFAALLRQATACYDRGDFHGAIAKLDTLGSPAAKDLSVVNLRAAALTKLGQYQQAADLFRSILETNPDYFPAAFNAGEVQFMAGDREGALETFRRLRQRDPQNELLRFKVFLCLVALGRSEDAAKMAQAMQPVGATPAWYYAQAILARSAGDEGKARKSLQAAHAIYGEAGCRLFDESVAAAGL